MAGETTCGEGRLVGTLSHGMWRNYQRRPAAAVGDIHTPCVHLGLCVFVWSGSLDDTEDWMGGKVAQKGLAGCAWDPWERWTNVAKQDPQGQEEDIEGYEKTGESSAGGGHVLGKVAGQRSLRLVGKSQEAWRKRAASCKGGSNTNAW